MPYHRCSSLPLVATIPIEVLLSLATGCSSLPLVATILIEVLPSLAVGAAISYHGAAIPSSDSNTQSGKAPAYNSKSKAAAPPSTTARRGLPRDTGERDFGVLEGEMG